MYVEKIGEPGDEARRRAGKDYPSSLVTAQRLCRGIVGLSIFAVSFVEMREEVMLIIGIKSYLDLVHTI